MVDAVDTGAYPPPRHVEAPPMSTVFSSADATQAPYRGTESDVGDQRLGAAFGAGFGAGGAKTGPPHAQPPRFDRRRPRSRLPALDRTQAWIGGVSGGMAGYASVPAIAIRLGWLTLAMVGGWGALLYLVAWVSFAIAETGGAAIDYGPPPQRARLRRWIGVVAIVFGMTILLAGLPGLPPLGSVGVCLCAIGATLERRGLLGADGAQARPASRGRSARLGSALVLAVGLSVVMFGAVLVAVSLVGFGPTGQLVVLMAVIGFVLASTTWPWWWGAISRMDQERQARIRADERAAVGAHLHDSVLQTLSLIQSERDPDAMIRLARKQERELRNWLDDGRVARDGAGLRGQIDALLTELEDHYGVRIEVVVVGDTIVDDTVAELLAASREAVVNAAQHAGVDTIDLYLEVGASRVDACVRDRGVGFDVAGAPVGLGIRKSIVDRLERAGGGAMISSMPGEGTEVELWVPVAQR